MTALEFSVFPGATSPVGFYLLRSAPCIPRSLMDSVRGWSQIANICQQNMQPDKTALDICHACFRMCAAISVDTLNLHVDLLGDRTTSVSACADGLVKRLLLCTGDALCLRRPPKVLWHVLLHIMIMYVPLGFFHVTADGARHRLLLRNFGLVLLLVGPCCGFLANTTLVLRDA